jgi:hypothetical protein
LNRRAFIASFAAACTLDPERLLWVPGKKTISIPKLVEWPSLLFPYSYKVYRVGKGVTSGTCRLEFDSRNCPSFKFV